MAAPQQGSLPPFFTLADGMSIRLTALDATTGAVVSGVTISDVSIDVDTDSPLAPEPPLSPFTGAYMQGDTV